MSSESSSNRVVDIKCNFEALNFATTPPCVTCGKKFKSAEILSRHLQQEHLNNAISFPNTVEVSGNKRTSKPQTDAELNGITSNIELYQTDIAACTSANAFLDDSLLGVEGLSNSHKLQVSRVKPSTKGFEKSFIRSNLVNNNKLPTVEQWTHKCVRCGNYFPSEENLQEHAILDTCERKTGTCTCEVCGKTFLLIYIKHHMQTHTGKPLPSKCVKYTDPSCVKCGKYFFTANNLQKHMDLDICEKNTCTCEICGESYPIAYIKQHMRTHTEQYTDPPLSYKCVKCGKYFVTVYNLQKHVNLDICVNKICTCEICGESYPVAYIKQHMRTHTGEEALPPKCVKYTYPPISHKSAKCGKYFASEYNLEKHMKLEICENKTCTCEICGESHPIATIKQHMRTHTGEKPYGCTKCCKKFSTRSAVTKHEVVHTKEKPYRCDVCGKAFPSKGYLQPHKRRHTTPYYCEICKKTFSEKYYVKKHMKTAHLNDHGDGLTKIVTDGKMNGKRGRPRLQWTGRMSR